MKVKIRFDYKGKHKPARFFWGGKNPHDVAQEAREQQVIMWRNIPIQGINVEKIDLGEIYQVYNEDIEDNISYAPLELVIKADSLEDILSFVVREEFRRIDILEPDSIMLNNKEIERFLFKINKLVQKQINQNAKEVK
ncbi:MAG: hypothetical protein GX767_08720 [Firmicutes bacterium]|nr:hypothetical protein [Bacillota bacterium]